MNDCFFLVSGFRHCREFLFYVDLFGNSLILEVIFALTESVLGSEVSLFFFFPFVFKFVVLELVL